jgi:integrase
MAGRLTQRRIEKAKPPASGQLIMRDSEIRGFAVRLTASACKTWVWDGRIRGQMRRITIGRYPDLSLSEARAAALQIRHDIAVGVDPAQQRREQREELTVGKLAALYLESHARQHKRSWPQDERRIRLHFRPLASLKLSALRPEIVARWHQRIGHERGRFQANRCHALLSAMFSYAIRLDIWKGDNPAKGIPHFHEESRSRFLNTQELTNLWSVLDSESSPYWSAYFKLALLLGMRKTELLSARWESVDLEEGIWTLPNTKNNRRHTLPIPQLAIEILKSLPSRGSSEWVFASSKRPGQSIGRADDAWQRIRQRAGIPDVRIHDLRRTNGSWLAAQGCSLPLIGRVLNHSQPSTTAIYARLDLGPIREALERNAKVMFGN